MLGQCVNFQKSAAYFSKSTQGKVEQQIYANLGETKEDHQFTYLGILVGVGRRKKVFAFIKEKVWKRVQSWKWQRLSKVGKELMIKMIAQAIPNYIIGLCLIPDEICHNIERTLNQFRWANSRNGGGVRSMRWSKLCRRKKEEGMGFRSLKDFNLALLGKQSWRILTALECLMVRILKARYFSECDFLSTEVKDNCSFIWRSICTLREIIKDG